MSLIRRTLLLFGLALLAACAGPAEPEWADEADVSRARYEHDGPTSVTLYTVISNKTGAGAHSALVINSDERIIFDPAGTWHHPHLPERNDVHFGITDPVIDFYIDYHTRITYHTIEQTIQVSPEVAAGIKRAALAHGAVPKAQCALSIGTILASSPRFADAPIKYFPKRLMEYFAKQPGVVTEEFRDYDSDDNSGVIMAPPVLFAQQNR